MLKNLFNPDNVVFRVLTKVFDLMVLNLLFIMCCIPIITCGTSATAFYTVMLKMADNREGYIVKDFLRAFKSNFKQSTIIWLIMLAVGGLIAGDWYFANKIGLPFIEILNLVFVILGICYLMVLSYVFPLQSKFENKVSATILNAFMTGIAYFFPWTIVVVALNLVPLLLLRVGSDVLFYVVIPILMLLGFSVIAYFNSKIFNHIFAKYIPEDEVDDTELW